MKRSLRRALAGLLLLSAAVAAPASAQVSDPLLDQARQAARSDRNREAADLFRQALAAHPDARRAILRELADQLTYSDRAGEAVPLYREVLSWGGLPAEERLRAERGLALALAWSGRHEEAIGAYSALLARDKSDRDARLNLARVETWSHRYGAAEADFRLLLAANPRDAEAIRGLAEAQSFAGHHREALETLKPITADADAATLFLLARTEYWNGRPDLAEGTVERALAAAPGNTEARRLRDEIRTAQRPQTEIGARYSSQSDKTDITQVSVAQTVHPGGAVEAVRLGYDLSVFDPASGPELTVHHPYAEARVRIADSAWLTANAGLQADRSSAGDREFFLYNVYGTLIPSDWLRFDVGVNRTTFDNVRSMLLGITATTYTASVDVGSDAGLKASLRGNLSEISDGNERRWGQVELRQRIGWAPNLFAGLRYTSFSFARQLDNGYFNPRSLDALEATAQLWGRTGRLYYDLRGSIGREDSNPGAPRLIYSAEGRLTYLVSPRFEFEAYVNSFSSRLSTPGGFSRTTTGGTLRLRW